MTNPIPTAAVDTKSFRGGFLLYRRDGKKLRRPRPTSSTVARPPRFRHPDFASAEAEAQRLLMNLPGSTFIILQEVARVKMKEQADG